MSESAKAAWKLGGVAFAILFLWAGISYQNEIQERVESSTPAESVVIDEEFGTDEVVLSASEFVDFAYTQSDIIGFCADLAVLGYDLAYDSFTVGAGEVGGSSGGVSFPSTSQVFNELVSRC